MTNTTMSPTTISATTSAPDTSDHSFQNGDLPIGFPVQLRILCLHDSHSNAAELKQALRVLGDRLYKKHGGIDLVYVNSPLTVPVESHALSDEPSSRVWWDESAPVYKNAAPVNTDAAATAPTSSRNFAFEVGDDIDGGNFDGLEKHKNIISSEETEAYQKHETKLYTGLDASLLMLQQVWTSCPYWGILGVGQGAAVASLLALSPFIRPPPSFCIFVSGSALLEESTRLVDPNTMPCLHLADSDTNDGESSNKLVQQFGGQVFHRRSRFSKCSTFGNDEINVMGKFIIEAKKNLFSTDNISSNNGEIVLLQSALHFVEQRAAALIAEEIAANPPSALMAVIRPQTVAGCVGNKRRQPGEEGGGAPCPSEFLLKRENRPNSASSTVSRNHPAQNTDKETS